MDKKLPIIAGTALVLIALIVGGYFFWKSSQKQNLPEKTLTTGTPTVPETAVDLTESATQGVLPSLNTNSLEDKPDLNPADKANPFKNVKTNPFK